MPEVLPAKLFLKQLGKKVIHGLTLTLRGAFVLCIWLVLLPYFTIWIWRLYFFLGGSLSKFLTKVQQIQFKFGVATTNMTGAENTNATAENLSWFQEYRSKITIQAFLADCFEGQIITCIVVVIFVAVFLLREWIVQNIPMNEAANEEEELNVVYDDLLFPEQQEQVVNGLQEQQPRLDREGINILANGNGNQPADVVDSNDGRLHLPLSIEDQLHDNNAEQSKRPFDPTNKSINDEKSRRFDRAASMPPGLSYSTIEDGYNSDASAEDQDMESLGHRRSASMEPIGRESMSTTASNSADITANANSYRAGHPPYAPRIRNAEVHPTFRQGAELNNVQPTEDILPSMIPVQPAQQRQQQRQQQHLAREPQAEGIRQQHIADVDNVNMNNVNNEEIEDEDEDNMEEFEGVLEAIGMQGSFWSLLQNCALMALLIALSLAVAIWMPYMIGMLFIMTDIADFIRLPLRLARLLTDPLVDFVFHISMNLIVPWCYQFYHQFIQSFFQYEVLLSSITLISANISRIYHFIANQLLAVTPQTTEASVHIPSSSLPSPFSLLLSSPSSLFTSLATRWKGVEPFLSSAYQRYLALAVGKTPGDRLACILIGYFIVTILSCRYLTRSTNNSIARAIFGRTAQEVIRYQGIILKVGMFILIELVLFPIVCGYSLDISTMPLFKVVTIASRLHYLKEHPVPSVFMHWFLGTGFMFLFAVLVTLCRDVVRPGVMWFIRDPNDPQFHPIREIVERPVLFQLKKIGASALIYLTVILVGVGGVVHFIKHITELILPLRWNIREPLSTMPIDMMVIQIAIPAIMKYFKPKRTLKKMFIKWITFTCRQLRLSSFMFGGRIPEEEGTLVYHNLKAWLRRALPSRYPPEGVIENIIGDDVSYYWDGQLLRVPRHDSVPIIENRRMLMPVDNFTLEPLDERERRLGHPASTAAGGDEINTVIVYSPPHFKQRILAFVIFIWITTSLSFTTSLVLPILLGRYIFREGFNIDHEVHDLYSFVLGAFIVLLAGTLAYQLFWSLKDIYSQNSWSMMYETACHQLKQWSFWLLRWTFFFISFGFVVPMSLGALAELYLLLPLRKMDDKYLTIPLVPMWVYGFIFMVVIHGFVDNMANNPLRLLINNIFRDGINKMQVGLCVKKLLVPLVITTATAIILPYLAAYVNVKAMGLENPELRVRLMQTAYPFALVGIGSYFLAKFAAKIGSRVVETVREDNYLIGRTLHNLDE
ncbi:hypothetical protein BDF20DRAFT_912388 [Mycotypha africana]|uniref:uncharacterized protein n=1 Tax=Mycotypha africana TaxID=64632 RepID=UPI0022FFF5B3|nr:uncharacterized protein BDF20DRAFT_912388 [Mycotypha africana]KAI8982189.1 hypothetical protein BDF20DRAFT_912388 [Mycotypha africana]